MLGIVVSRADSASVHIGEQLLELEDWERIQDDSRPGGAGGGTVYRTDGIELREFDERHLDLERPAEAFDEPRLLAFASRHSGETGPLLTAHHTGNFGPADHGGADNAVARACPNAHAVVIDALDRYAPADYDVGIECTHHGPTDVGAPSLFVEVGSGEQQWEERAAARAVAKAILALRDVPPDRPVDDSDPGDANEAARRHLVGFGGGHYAPRFERVLRETEWAIGHIAADWGLEAMGELTTPGSRQVLAAAFEESRAAYTLVDGDRPAVEAAVESLGYRAVSETWVRETAEVPLQFVTALEDAVALVENGLRFGEPATDGTPPSDWQITELPRELLDETFGIDQEATLAAVAETALAFVTEEGGTRPAGTVVLPPNRERRTVIDRLATLLEQRYDEVTLEDDRIVATKQAFDPERAKTLGVPEGPAFGKLAAGQAVEVDGETIPPEVVQSEKRREFSIR